MNILYMPVKGIDFVSVYGFRSDFEIVPTSVVLFCFSFDFTQQIDTY